MNIKIRITLFARDNKEKRLRLGKVNKLILEYTEYDTSLNRVLYIFFG